MARSPSFVQVSQVASSLSLPGERSGIAPKPASGVATPSAKSHTCTFPLALSAASLRPVASKATESGASRRRQGEGLRLVRDCGRDEDVAAAPRPMPVWCLEGLRAGRARPRRIARQGGGDLPRRQIPQPDVAIRVTCERLPIRRRRRNVPGLPDREDGLHSPAGDIEGHASVIGQHRHGRLALPDEAIEPSPPADKIVVAVASGSCAKCARPHARRRAASPSGGEADLGLARVPAVRAGPGRSPRIGSIIAARGVGSIRRGGHEEAPPPERRLEASILVLLARPCAARRASKRGEALAVRAQPNRRIVPACSARPRTAWRPPALGREAKRRSACRRESEVERCSRPAEPARLLCLARPRCLSRHRGPRSCRPGAPLASRSGSRARSSPI